MQIISQYFHEAILKFPKKFLKSLGWVLAITLLNVAFPYGLRMFIDVISQNAKYSQMIIGIVLFAVFLFLQTLAQILYNMALDDFGGLYIEELTLILEKSIAETSFDECEKYGWNTIKHVLYADVLDVFRVIGHHLPNLIGSSLVILVILGVSFGLISGLLYSY